MALSFFIPLQFVAFWGASRSVHGRIKNKSACFWLSVDRYLLHRVACKIWRRVVHLGSEKKATLFEINGGQKFIFIIFNFPTPPFEERTDLGKSLTFFWYGQPDFKFDIDSEGLFINRMILRKTDSIGWLVAFDTTPIGRFWRLLGPLTVAYNIEVLVSGYQSIDMHCIMVALKFDNELSISFLRNRLLLTKKKGSKNHIFKRVWFFNFQTPHFEEKTDLGKSLTFLESIFLVNGIHNPTSNLT
jgi:hypothetical protein